MKKYYIFCLFFISTLFYGQTDGISYQAVIYNPSPELLPGYSQTNAPLVNTDVCLRFSIIDVLSNVEYQETINTTTDEFGMVNLIIGSGNPIGGYASIFDDIVWDSTTKRLKVELDASGKCSNFLEISNQPFTAVPFAYAAERAENVTGVVAIANGGTGATTVSGAKTNLGLNNVNNTSDLNKPISIATQTVLNLKENASNKSSDINLGTSNLLFPTQNAVKTYVDSKINSGSSNLASEIARAQAAETALATNLSNEVARATAAETTLTTNLDNEVTRAKAAELVLTNTKEDVANKSNDGTLATNSDIKFPTEQAVKTYVDTQITAATPNASTLVKGKIKLAGDLTGTADFPLVQNDAITSAKIANGTILNEDIANGTITSAKIAGTISIENGGTGASTVAGAKINLGLDNVDNTSDLNKPLSIATINALDKKLDKTLTKAETIETTSTNTLAIKGLENTASASYELVSIDPSTGVLRKISPSGVVVIKEVVYTANADENQFITPKLITDINKVSVYRNGVKIGLTMLDSTHIQLESGVLCDDNDEIRIVQYD